MVQLDLNQNNNNNGGIGAIPDPDKMTESTNNANQQKDDLFIKQPENVEERKMFSNKKANIALIVIGVVIIAVLVIALI